MAGGGVLVDDVVITDPRCEINQFSRIELDQQVLQATPAKYFMLHKPAGVVSATVHDEHRTVLDLLSEDDRQGLHLAGRLDLKTTGLMLLTNDGRWSRRITQPEKSFDKVYRVETQDPVPAQAAEVFRQGIYFSYEDITTRPARLELINSHTSRLILNEGRYHQVKRMFGYFDNEVINLHRESMGQIELDPKLEPGQYRALTRAEIESV